MKYLPLSYFSYHLPYYVASWLVVILFATFISMMYLAMKYEIYNKQHVCDPMYYYGKPCYNYISERLLTNSAFSDARNTFYNNLDTYEPETAQFKGAKQTTINAKQIIEKSSKPAIERAMEKDKEFIEENTSQINNMTSILQVLSLKYLGNLQETIEETKDLPDGVQDQLTNIPNEIEDLRILVKESLVDPVYTRYSAPLNKLYRSLSEIKEPSNSH